MNMVTIGQQQALGIQKAYKEKLPRGSVLNHAAKNKKLAASIIEIM
jgi:hypothetical protein